MKRFEEEKEKENKKMQKRLKNTEKRCKFRKTNY